VPVGVVLRKREELLERRDLLRRCSHAHNL
jgi:hypothetical protein